MSNRDIEENIQWEPNICTFWVTLPEAWISYGQKLEQCYDNVFINSK